MKAFLLKLFNNILKLEFFPSAWAIGCIIPIYKGKGDSKEANNFRGITLLSCVGKLFTNILNTRLQLWAEQECKIGEEQFGFRSGRGVTDCVFTLHGLVEMLFAQNKVLYCAFIDYEKAYDFLNRTIVWFKLLKEGVSSKCVRVLQNMYSKIKLQIRAEESRGYFNNNCGILQGETTSPIMFSLFVNDILTCLNDDIGIKVENILIKLLMFADDMVLVSETREGLQLGLDDLHSYCVKWGMKVNIDKTKIVVFKKGGRTSKNDNWTYNGYPVDVVSSFKYLGYYLSSTGSFRMGTQELLKAARKALFSLKKSISNNPEILPHTQLQLFHSTIEPILHYCSEIWGLSKAEPLERFYLSFLKSILCVKSSTPNCFVYGELGVLPLFIQRKIRVVKYWLKIISVDRRVLFPFSVYKRLLELSIDKPNCITWATLVKDVLNKCGLGYAWVDQCVNNETEFLSIFRERVKDMFLQNWRSEVERSSNNRLYKHIKPSFSYEMYLTFCSKVHRISLTRIRLSSHSFNIERGRWGAHRVPVNERLCTECGVVEDEYHCLIECCKFEECRQGYLPKTLAKKPSMFQFVNIFKTEYEKECKMLSVLCTRVLREYAKFTT